MIHFGASVTVLPRTPSQYAWQQRCSTGSLGREIPGNFPFPGKQAGNFRTSGIPEFREFPVAREFPVSREIPEVREFPKAREIPEPREIPKIREIPGNFPQKFPGKFPYLGNFPWLGNFSHLGKFLNHGKFPGNGKFLENGKFPGISVWEIPGREISQASREGGNGNFPLNITGTGWRWWLQF